jgi:hypothetical protein
MVQRHQFGDFGDALKWHFGAENSHTDSSVGFGSAGSERSAAARRAHPIWPARSREFFCDRRLEESEPHQIVFHVKQTLGNP